MTDNPANLSENSRRILNEEPFPGSPDDMMQTIASLTRERDEALSAYKYVKTCMHSFEKQSLEALDQIATLRAQLEEARAQVYRDSEAMDIIHRAAELVNDTPVVVLARQLEAAKAALRRLVDDIHDYERVNNLAPNPPRTECWDSVADALALLKGKPAP